MKLCERIARGLSEITIVSYFSMFSWKGNNIFFKIMNEIYFANINVMLANLRCNDVLELVQTMRHFQILSKTVSIGGSDNRNMDILAQEIHTKYVRALSEFQANIKVLMNFENKEQNFEISFFNLRTTIKVDLIQQK